VLTGGLAGVVGAALAGCTSGSAATPSAAAASPAAAASADDAAVTRARATAGELATAAERLARAGAGSARLLADVAADHRAHLAALGAAVPSPAPAASPSPSASASDRQGLAAAARSESKGAQAALDDVSATSPAVAVLLARIAAARAAHADLLSTAAGLRPPGRLVPSLAAAAAAPSGPAGAASGPDDAGPAVAPSGSVAADGPLPPPPAGVQPAVPAAGPTPSTGGPALAAAAREALVALTAGEHAAVFAYGLVAARVPAAQRDRARAGWAWHLERRDLLEDRLLTAGVHPPAAAPAYDVGGAPSRDGAARLAATVEQRLAALAIRTVAATQGDDRLEAAVGLVEGARRAAAWSGRPQALL
jgi:hypothetical protein